MRAAILPPTPTPYREPLFRRLAGDPELEIVVIYQSELEPGWDMPTDWFPAEHPYPAKRLRSWQRRRAGRTPIVWSMGLERALTDADPDCAIAWEYGPASLRTMRWCRRHGRGFAVFTECTPWTDAQLWPGQLRLHRWVARRAGALLAASSAAGERLRGFGVPEERIVVGLQSADLARFRAIAGGRDSSGRAPVTVLTVGRLVPDKNLGMLLDAYARVGLTAAEARLELVGTGFLADDLARRAQALGIAARFRGHLSPADLPPVYAAADVFALPSTYEPFGVVVREAVAAGLPIVCSRRAGAAGDVAVEGRNALLVDPESVDELARALRRIVDDSSLRERMGAESLAIDRELEGRDVEAFKAAIAAASARRSAPSDTPRASTRRRRAS